MVILKNFLKKTDLKNRQTKKKSIQNYQACRVNNSYCICILFQALQCSYFYTKPLPTPGHLLPRVNGNKSLNLNNKPSLKRKLEGDTGKCSVFSHMDFPRPDLGPNISPFPIKNEPKIHKMVDIFPNFLVLHFGESFMKIRTKIAKLQMHENLHKNVNENVFSFTFFMKFFMSFYKVQFKQQICYSFILLIFYMVFIIHFEWRPSSFRLHKVFPILMVQMLFLQIQQATDPDFRKVGKSISHTFKRTLLVL